MTFIPVLGLFKKKSTVQRMQVKPNLIDLRATVLIWKEIRWFADFKDAYMNRFGNKHRLRSIKYSEYGNVTPPKTPGPVCTFNYP